MELKKRVACAARDGELAELKRLLDHKPREEVELLVSLQTNGATPLAIACQNGHLDVVLYLIKECKADVEQVCSVIVDGETVEETPPLWLAAYAGHLCIVKTLVRYKASVNSTTETSSTPLRAACFHGHFEIAKYLVQHGADIEIANKHGHTCLMIACYKGHYEIAEMLIQYGANVNRNCLKEGYTALHECVVSGSLEILKLLLERGAECACDSDGNTPLLSAAVSGRASIVEYFIEDFDCSKEEKINALELLSATCMDEKQDIKALAYWKRAMIMRYEDSDFPQEKSSKHSSIASYIDAVEVHNFEQLENLILDPDKARLQALLVRERILGPGHLHTHYSLRIVGANFADNCNYNKCIQFWIYDLDVQQGIQEPLSKIIQDSLSSFVELFSELMSQDLYFSTEYPAALFKNIFSVFKSALKEIGNAIKSSETISQALTDCSNFHSTLVISLHLIGLMCKLQPHLNKTEAFVFQKAVYELVLMNPRTRNGLSLLHLACNKDSCTIGLDSLIYFPSPEVVNLLFQVGACPNAMDLSGSTPLHIIIKNTCLPSGNTPLLSAAASGHASIVEHFIEDFDCSKEEKINALELLGATCIDEEQDEKALIYWTRAMIMRYESEFPPEKSTTYSHIASYIDAVEVRNFEQLEDLISDPDEARVQALLVRERILGPGHPDTHYSLRIVGANFADNSNYNKCIQLWIYDLDVQQGVQEPLSKIIQDSLSSFVELFFCMMSQDLYFSREYLAVLFKDVFSVFERAVKEVENAIKSSESRSRDLTDCSHFHRTLVISLHLIGLMCKLQPHLNKTEELELKRAVFKLVLMDPRTRKGCSLLHLACNKDSSTIDSYPSLISFPSPEIVDLLLEVGACPNAMDFSGSTPLHVIAKKPCLPPVFKTLLNYGAHLDFRNSEGKTALDIDQNSLLLGVYPLQYINLQCLSAQVVRSHKIPYRGLVHKRLEKFLDMH